MSPEELASRYSRLQSWIKDDFPGWFIPSWIPENYKDSLLWLDAMAEQHRDAGVSLSPNLFYRLKPDLYEDIQRTVAQPGINLLGDTSTQQQNQWLSKELLKGVRNAGLDPSKLPPAKELYRIQEEPPEESDKTNWQYRLKTLEAIVKQDPCELKPWHKQELQYAASHIALEEDSQEKLPLYKYSHDAAPKLTQWMPWIYKTKLFEAENIEGPSPEFHTALSLRPVKATIHIPSFVSSPHQSQSSDQ